jgi:UDP-N-acetylmuramoyl-tripeptide--D-alanyl-D-alanine ligase
MVSGALVVDDTYNANPASMLASLRALVELSRARGGQAVAALGDMAELGTHAQAEHERVGRDAVLLGVSALFLCGDQMGHAAGAARAEAAEHKLSPRIEHFADPLQSVPMLAAALGAHDALLVKGSRSMRMERVVDALCPAPSSGGRA